MLRQIDTSSSVHIYQGFQITCMSIQTSLPPTGAANSLKSNLSRVKIEQIHQGIEYLLLCRYSMQSIILVVNLYQHETKSSFTVSAELLSNSELVHGDREENPMKNKNAWHPSVENKTVSDLWMLLDLYIHIECDCFACKYCLLPVKDIRLITISFDLFN